MRYPVTPDGRYFVVRERLWRLSDPHLAAERRQELVSDLMAARRAVAHARKADDLHALQAARSAVDCAKRALGERGKPWWSDGAPDYNRQLARTTPYRDWYEHVSSGQAAPPGSSAQSSSKVSG